MERSSDASTVLLVILLVIVIGVIVWFFATQRNRISNEGGARVEVTN